jgi:hypothetical protein
MCCASGEGAPFHHPFTDNKGDRNNPNLLKMAIFRLFSAYQSWQAPACLHFLHRNLLEILLIFSPSEF